MFDVYVVCGVSLLMVSPKSGDGKNMKRVRYNQKERGGWGIEGDEKKDGAGEKIASGRGSGWGRRRDSSFLIIEGWRF